MLKWHSGWLAIENIALGMEMFVPGMEVPILEILEIEEARFKVLPRQSIALILPLC